MTSVTLEILFTSEILKIKVDFSSSPAPNFSFIMPSVHRNNQQYISQNFSHIINFDTERQYIT